MDFGARSSEYTYRLEPKECDRYVFEDQNLKNSLLDSTQTKSRWSLRTLSHATYPIKSTIKLKPRPGLRISCAKFKPKPNNCQSPHTKLSFKPLLVKLLDKVCVSHPSASGMKQTITTLPSPSPTLPFSALVWSSVSTKSDCNRNKNGARML